MTLVFLPRLSDLASTLCLQPQCSKSFGDVETTSDHLGSFWSDISDKRVAPTREAQRAKGRNRNPLAPPRNSPELTSQERQIASQAGLKGPNSINILTRGRRDIKHDHQ